ncbi:radical SAM protein [Litoricolaceae bacterium]|nr:radical SAM protein [Litorivicinaceae bacterium]
MKFCFLDIYRNEAYRISKDTAGGYGTANDLGDGIFGRLLSRAVRFAVHWPNLQFVQLMTELKKAGHACQYEKTTSIGSLHHFAQFDAVFVCNSIVCFETEIAASELISKLSMTPVFICGTVFRHTKKILPQNCCSLSGNYEFLDADLFGSKSRLSEMVLERFIHVSVPSNANLLNPIEWGLDGLGVPRNLIVGGRRPYIPFLFNRGCPYSCAEYCTYPTSQGRKVFSVDIEEVVGKLRFYEQRFGSIHVVFRDPVFSIDLKKSKRLLEAIIEANLNVEFSAELHLKNLDEEFIDLAARANLNTIKFGIESAFDHVRSSVNRVSVDNDEQFRAISELRSNGIRTVGMFILAQPSDTLETCEKTIDYACDLGLDIAQFSVFTPYPGTSFYEKIERKITVGRYEDFTQFKLTFEHESFSESGVRKLLEKAYCKFLVSKFL